MLTVPLARRNSLGLHIEQKTFSSTPTALSLKLKLLLPLPVLP